MIQTFVRETGKRETTGYETFDPRLTRLGTMLGYEPPDLSRCIVSFQFGELFPAARLLDL